MEEKQKITVTIVFKEKMNPGNEKHLQEILTNFFKAKGVDFNGYEIYV